MPEHNNHINEFLQTICSQIRFKSVHKSIVNELSDHITEQKLNYIKAGLDEKTATEKALVQMGDPIIIGKQLDKAHQPKTEWSILSLAAILVVMGGAVQFFISTAYIYTTQDPKIFQRFLIYASIGIAALVFTYFSDYTLIGKYSKLVYITLFIAALAGFLAFNRVNGSYTHVYYAALLFIPAYAGVIYGYRNKGYLGILACGLFYVPAALICIIAPRLSGLMLLSVACLILLTIAIRDGIFKCNKKVGLAIVYIPTAILAIIPIKFIFFTQYARKRLLVMVSPELDSLGAGWQHLMVKKLVVAAQPFGKAVLKDNPTKTPIELLLPGWASDFSLTYIIARFGYVAGMVIALTFFILIIRMFISAINQKNRFGSLLSCAACISITGQFVLYMLSNTGVLLAFSSTLPFISFGGMGFVTNMILVGFVLSVHRRTNIAIESQQNDHQNNQLITFRDGKLIIDFGTKFSKSTK